MNKLKCPITDDAMLELPSVSTVMQIHFKLNVSKHLQPRSNTGLPFSDDIK